MRGSKKKIHHFNVKETRLAWLFITPYLIGYTLFHFIPLVISLLMSFTNIRYISRTDQLVLKGISNYFEMFQDDLFRLSLRNSFFFSLLYVPLILITGLILAILIDQKLYARNLIRSMVFMPYVSNMVAVAIVWSILLDPISGPVNILLKSLGIGNPPLWLMSTKSALKTVVLIAVWQGVGLQFITYLAALQNVPHELKEAASIDGAAKHQIFWYVTFPSILPTTFFLTITSVIGSLKNFTVIQVLTEGGPGNSTTVLPLNIVNTAFSSMRLGYASAQAMLMFLIVMFVTIIQWKLQKRFID